MERLEHRVLLSGSHDPALISAMASALSNPGSGAPFTSWLNRFNDGAVLSQPLPFVGGGLGATTHPKAIVDSLLTRIGASYGSFAALRTAMEGGAGIADGVEVISFADDSDLLSMRVHFVGSETQSTPLTANFGSVDLPLSGSVTLQTFYDFTLDVGAYWTGSSGLFYIDGSSDSVITHSAVTGNTVGPSTRLGFVDVTLTSPSLTLSPDFAINFKDPSASGVAGRVSLAEISAATTAQLLSATASASAATRFTGTVATSAAIGLPPANVQFDWANVTDLTPSGDNLSTLGAYNGLAHVNKSTLTGGFDQFAGFIDKAASLSLSRTAPIAGDGIGKLVDLPGMLRDRFVTNAGTYTTAETFATRLTQLAGISNSTFQFSPTQLIYTIDLASSKNAFVALKLGLADLDLRFDGSAIRLFADMTGKLKFGIDLATQKFFVADDAVAGPEFSVSASVHSTGINAAGAIGFIAANVVNGSADLVATVTMDLTDTTDGRIDGDDLTSPIAYATRVQSNLSGSSSATLPMASSLVGFPQTTLNFSWSDLNDIATLHANTQDFDALKAYSKITADGFATGIAAMIDLLSYSAEDENPANPLHVKLPIVDRAIHELIDVPSQLGTITNAAIVGQEPTFHNTTDLLGVLRGISGVGNANASFQLSGDAVEYTLHMHKTLVSSMPVSLDVDNVVDLSVAGTATATMTLDVDLKFGVTFDGTFYIATGPTPNLSTSGGLALAMTPAGRFGFFGVTVGAATASFNPQASIRFIDPAIAIPPTVNRITFDEADSNNQAAYSTRSFTGSASVSLPLTTSVTGVSPGTLMMNWSDLVGAAPTANTSGVSQMAAYQNVHQKDAVDGFIALPALVDAFSGTTGFGRDLKLLGGNLGSLPAPGNPVRSMLPNLGEFKTAQGLELGLEEAFFAAGITLNVTTVAVGTDLKYTLNIPAQAFTQSVKVKLNETISGVAFNTSLNANLTGTQTVNLIVGLDATGLGSPDRFFVDPASNAVVSFRMNATGVNATGTIGFNNIGIAGGTVNIAGITSGVINTGKNAAFTIPLTDPDGHISVTNFSANPGGFFGSASSEIAASGSLPITGLPAPGASPHIDLSSLDLRSGALTITPVNLGSLTSNFGFANVQKGIDGVKLLITSLLNEPVLNTNIPFVNQPLKSLFDFTAEALQFWNGLNQGATATAFDAHAHDVANGLGANWSLVSNNAPTDHDPSNSKLRYLLTYNRSIPLGNAPFNIGANFLSLNGNISGSLDFGFTIGFGINQADGFYVTDQSTFGLNAHLAGAFDRIGGEISGLEYGVHNGTATIDFGLTAPVTDTDADHKIRLGDLTGNLATIINPTVSGVGAVVLPMGVFLGDNGPGVKTTFRAYWDANQPTVLRFSPQDRGTIPISSLSTELSSAFGPVEFEIGDFIASVIGPALQKVNEFNPLIGDILETLNFDIPLIGKAIDLLHISLGSNATRAIKLLVGIAELTSSLPTDGSTLNLSSHFPVGQVPNSGSSGGFDGGVVTSTIQGFLNDLKDEYDIELLSLDPDNLGASLTSAVANILGGKDVDLIRWNPSRFEKTWRAPVASVLLAAFPIPLGYVTITMNLHGGFGFFADADFGFSSRGLRDPDGDGVPNLIDGFFFGDNLNADGSDNPEIGLSGSVGVGITGRASLFGLVGGKLTANGDLVITVGADFSDLKPDPTNPPTNLTRVGFTDTGGDGRVYIDELDFLVANYGPTCAITPVGRLSLEVSGEVAVEILGFIPIAPIPFKLFDIVLKDFEFVECHTESTDLADYASISGALNLKVDTSNTKYLSHTYRVEIVDDAAGDPDLLRVSKTEKGRQPRLIDTLATPTEIDLFSFSAAPPDDLFGNELEEGVVARNVITGKRYQLAKKTLDGYGFYVWEATDKPVTVYTLSEAETYQEDFSRGIL